ncbi:lipopolysaccharide transport system permease protein [Tepidimonas ignava]|uniref:ABC-2 type transporter n=1 Tax=Tepidimonas ignava TaxID=114249 RepID=A0A4R3LF46_9BURK|nr:ABC transporter permease [Tepidimonas ignava]TCS98801.1 lipopolysaccharide transport system permease protein [Tepidimonas ignava]TSE20274.1 ABC-2 type transporter [Tepidimonas ignava]
MQVSWRFARLLVAQGLLQGYRQFRLGAWWAVLPNYVQLGVLAVVMGGVLSHKLPAAASGQGTVPYILYFLPGVVLWQAFQNTVLQASEVLVAQRLIIKKNQVDIPTLGLYVPIVQWVHMALAVALVWVAAAVLYGPPGLGTVLLTLGLGAVCIVFGYVSGLAWGLLAVALPDIRQALPPLLNVGFWLTPIVYPASLVPAAWQGALAQWHPWYALMAPVQSAWSGVPPLPVPPWAAPMPWLMAVLHVWLVLRVLRHGRRQVLDAL